VLYTICQNTAWQYLKTYPYHIQQVQALHVFYVHMHHVPANEVGHELFQQRWFTDEATFHINGKHYSCHHNEH